MDPDQQEQLERDGPPHAPAPKPQDGGTVETILVIVLVALLILFLTGRL